MYDINGQLVAEYGGQAAGTGGTHYLMLDVQGSTRVVMNGSAAIEARHDYLPFGEEIQSDAALRTAAKYYGAEDSTRQRYGGMERDANGLDHTLWRKYESRAGRWTSHDPYGGSMSVSDPQSFNRYAYGGNDPVNRVDPSGLFWADASMGSEFIWGGLYGGEGRSSSDLGRGTFYGGSVVEEQYRAYQGMVYAGCRVLGVDIHLPEGMGLSDLLGYDALPQNPPGRVFDDSSLGPPPPPPVPIYCQPDVIKAMERAWLRTQNGISGNEAGFVLNGTQSKYQIVDTKSGNTKGYQSFSINISGANPTFLLFHVHPNNSTRNPSTPNNNSLGNKTGDTGIANKYNLLFLVGHRTGLTLYDPKVGSSVDLRDNLDWLTPCK